MHFVKKIYGGLKYCYKTSLAIFTSRISNPTYKIISIEKSATCQYMVLVQISNTRHVIKMQAEEILCNDKLTDSFSQRDIRTLTCVGYLNINAPQYKILAQHISENDRTIKFMIKERGKKETLNKTAEEISLDKDFLNKLSPTDAHIIGYTSSAESLQNDKILMETLIKNCTKQS